MCVCVGGCVHVCTHSSTKRMHYFGIRILAKGRAGSVITNGREPRSCLDRVFNYKFSSFTDNTKNVASWKWPLLKLKTLHRFVLLAEVCPWSEAQYS